MAENLKVIKIIAEQSPQLAANRPGIVDSYEAGITQEEIAQRELPQICRFSVPVAGGIVRQALKILMEDEPRRRELSWQHTRGGFMAYILEKYGSQNGSNYDACLKLQGRDLAAARRVKVVSDEERAAIIVIISSNEFRHQSGSSQGRLNWPKIQEALHDIGIHYAKRTLQQVAELWKNNETRYEYEKRRRTKRVSAESD